MALGKVAVIVGVGPGTGGAVAKRFAAGGYAVGLVARKVESSQATHDQITAEGGKAVIVTADTGSATDVKRAYKEIVDKFRASPEVLVFNAGGGGIKSWPPPRIDEIDPKDFQATFANGVTGALLWIQQVVPEQIKAGKGTILLTGATAALRGGAGFALLSSHKFALRSLGQTAARELQPKGIHVAHVIIDGRIKREGSLSSHLTKDDDLDKFLLPEQIAEEYWKLHTQHKSTWAQEIDLRPFTEKW